jgi:hypothetical protein
MFNLNINFLKVIKNNLLHFLRTPVRLNFLNAAAKPFKQMHSEFLVIVDYYIRRIRFTGQVCYIEQALNERYDAVLKRIYIEDYGTNELYIFQTAEAEPPLYIFNEWNAATAYVAGEYSQVGFDVYLCNVNNTNKPPAANPTEWTLQTDEGVTLNLDANFVNTITFIVWVPVSITFDTDELTSIVNAFKLAGRSFVIQTF